MQPNSIASRCLAILAEGPATTAEVALELGLTSHLAGTHLQQLEKRKKATSKPFGVAKYADGRPRARLWSLAA